MVKEELMKTKFLILSKRFLIYVGPKTQGFV